MRLKTANILAFALLAGCSGAEEPGGSQNRAALEAILEAQRSAHLELDADRLVEQIADELVSIDSGVITVQTRAEVREMFASYFEGATYFAWEDLEPPLMKISADGSLAWVVRRVGVDREEPDGSGGHRRRQFVSAYTSTFEKSDGEWRMTTVTSTFAPSESIEAQ
jgi:ketosteroid isomerase-like protein